MEPNITALRSRLYIKLAIVISYQKILFKIIFYLSKTKLECATNYCNIWIAQIYFYLFPQGFCIFHIKLVGISINNFGDIGKIKFFVPGSNNLQFRVPGFVLHDPGDSPGRITGKIRIRVIFQMAFVRTHRRRHIVLKKRLD